MFDPYVKYNVGRIAKSWETLDQDGHIILLFGFETRISCNITCRRLSYSKADFLMVSLERS